MTGSPFFFFLHIPKTAGTTWRSIIDLQLGSENVITYYNQSNSSLIDNLWALVASKPNNLGLIGHYNFGVHNNLNRAPLTNREYKYYTFLRNPIDITVSAYYERLKRYPNEFKKQNGTTMTILEHIESHQHFYDNIQTRMIAGTPGSRKINQQELILAKENINNNFDFVGILEKFDESILLLSKILKWRPCRYGALNQNLEPKTLDQITEKYIKKITFYDSQLYNFALEQLNEIIENQTEIFKEALFELNKLTKNLSQETNILTSPSSAKEKIERYLNTIF
ncbi:MAG: sulfotransferase family 2 domain-containing protein [Rhodospirillales bacterium]|tara:strand:+ start:4460 stop:5302 length:843 start_codon:yes stop_codon:yes gene_type:complete